MWEKAVDKIVYVLIGLLLTVIGFLLAQNMKRSSDISSLRLEVAEFRSEVRQEMALQGLTLGNVADKVDRITEITVKGKGDE